jgi:hypothetical protein
MHSLTALSTSESDGPRSRHNSVSPDRPRGSDTSAAMAPGEESNQRANAREAPREKRLVASDNIRCRILVFHVVALCPLTSDDDASIVADNICCHLMSVSISS